MVWLHLDDGGELNEADDVDTVGELHGDVDADVARGVGGGDQVAVPPHHQRPVLGGLNRRGGALGISFLFEPPPGGGRGSGGEPRTQDRGDGPARWGGSKKISKIFCDFPPAISRIKESPGGKRWTAGLTHPPSPRGGGG